MKRSKIITKQPKSLGSPSTIGIKLVALEHLKACHKLSKTMRQTKKISQVVVLAKILRALYIVK